MHDPAKFESSGQQPETGIELYLQNLNENNDSTDAIVVEGQLATHLKEAPRSRVHYVTTVCYTCHLRIRITVSATPDSLRLFEESFLRGLSFFCSSCGTSPGNDRR
ncbi:E7 early protein [Bos taurus papillomavirus 31]|nr:E7 early protein [Bos taurus papillomavirus 31]